MTTICADDLLREAPARPTVESAPRPATAARPRHEATRQAEPERPRPLRHEDHELRSSGLGDLLGGQVFPRSV